MKRNREGVQKMNFQVTLPVEMKCEKSLNNNFNRQLNKQAKRTSP